MKTTNTGDDEPAIRGRHLFFGALLLILVAAPGAAAQGGGPTGPPLTEEQKDRCENIRRVLMGEDGTGRASGLRYERSRLGAIVQLLQKESDAVQRETSMETVDNEIAADLAMLKGAAPGWQHDEVYNLAVRDLFYWTAKKHRKMQLAKGYGLFVQQALTQEQRRLSAINSSIAIENDVADELKCKAYWASHPVRREPKLASSTATTGPACLDTKPGTPEREACCDRSYTDPNTRFYCRSQKRLNPTDARTFNQSFGNQNPNAGQSENIKVVGSFQCEVDDKEIGPLGGAIFVFRPVSGGDNITVVLNSKGWAEHVNLPAGAYTLRMPTTETLVPQFGDAKLLWAQVRILGGPDQGTKYTATSDGDIFLNFAPVGRPNAVNYEVGVRVSSLHLCRQ